MCYPSCKSCPAHEDPGNGTLSDVSFVPVWDPWTVGVRFYLEDDLS